MAGRQRHTLTETLSSLAVLHFFESYLFEVLAESQARFPRTTTHTTNNPADTENE